MDSNYDKLKKLLSEDNSPIPPELNWEQMEKGILQKMDELQSDQSIPSNKRRRIKSGLIITTLCILLLSLFLCTRIKNESVRAVLGNHTTAAHDESPEQLTQNGASVQFPSSLEDPNCNQPITDNGLVEDILIVPALNQSQDSNRSKRSASLSKNAKGNLNHIKIQNREQDKMDKGEIDLVESPTSIDQEKFNSNTPVVLLPTKDLMDVRASKPVNLPDMFQVAPAYKPDPKHIATPSPRIALMSGLSWWTEGYGSAKPERDQNERSITSFNAQLNYIHTLKKDYTLLIGFQFQQLESRFDWSNTIDDYIITLIDTVMQIQTNSLTGQQSEVRGDVEVNVPAVRTVRHYNQTRLYQIPLAVGKTWTFKNWQADVLFGGSLNFLSENKGRTLYLGEIQDYDGAATDFLENQWNLHGLLMGRLSYRINDHFGLTTGVQFQKSLTNWSTESNIQMRPNVLNWEVGMNYLLN